MQSGGDGERLNASQIATILASRFSIPAPPTTLPGDFNGSGRVDGADFLVWQRGGSPIRLSDLNLWRSNFGRTGVTPASAAVPEPQAFLIAATGMIALALVRARRRRSASHC